MVLTGNEHKDLDCREALKDLFKHVFNEVSCLLRDYPSQSNIVYEEIGKLAIELQSLTTRHERPSSDSSVTAEELALFVTSILALNGVADYPPANSQPSTVPSIPVSRNSEGEIENRSVPSEAGNFGFWKPHLPQLESSALAISNCY